MNNKGNGFIFIETIIVIVLLSVGLVMVYSSFSAVLSNDKRRASFNDVAFVYRTYYIENYLLTLNIDDYIDEFLLKNNNEIVEFSCYPPLLYKIDNQSDLNSESMSDANTAKLAYCTKLMNELNVNKIYITKYNINTLKHCTTRQGKLVEGSNCNQAIGNAATSLNSNTIYYIRTLNGNDMEGRQDYRIIVEYKDEFIDADETITKVKESTTNSYKCPDGYELNADDVCQRKIVRYYYANVRMVLKRYLKGDLDE